MSTPAMLNLSVTAAFNKIRYTTEMFHFTPKRTLRFVDNDFDNSLQCSHFAEFMWKREREMSKREVYGIGSVLELEGSIK